MDRADHTATADAVLDYVAAAVRGGARAARLPYASAFHMDGDLIAVYRRDLARESAEVHAPGVPALHLRRVVGAPAEVAAGDIGIVCRHLAMARGASFAETPRGPHPSSEVLIAGLLSLVAREGDPSAEHRNTRILRRGRNLVEVIRHRDHVVVVVTARGREVFVAATRPERGDWQLRVGVRRDGRWMNAFPDLSGTGTVDASSYGLFHPPGRRRGAASGIDGRRAR